MTKIIPPGATIGILGGGQLGRMAAIAAAQMGYHVHIFAPDVDSPAFSVSAAHHIAAYTDHAALKSFAADVDVVTCEFENVPAACLETLSHLLPVRPSPTVFSICQERLREKDFLRSIGVAVAPYAKIESLQDLSHAINEMKCTAILKSASLGYDGKGQARITARDPASLAEAWEKVGAQKAILESFIDFSREISVLVARSPNGMIAIYEPTENQHRDHILDQSVVPARISKRLKDKAETIARHIALELQLEGLLAVEMFITLKDDILVNELAPRPHNSGHWTIDASITSQFEQFIRSVCNLPLGSPARLCDASMKNLLGDDIDDWSAYLSEPNTKLHLYGKNDAKRGRKMGHITRLTPLL